MFTTKDMWKAYNADNKSQVVVLEIKLKHILDQKKYIYFRLKAQEAKAFKYTNMKPITMAWLAGLHEDNISKLQLKPFIEPPEDFSVGVMQSFMRKFAALTNIEKRLKARIKYLDVYMPYDIYVFLIRKFNMRLSAAIVKGYAFYPGFGLGRIAINRIERWNDDYKPNYRKVIDWGNTMKLKKQLIAANKPLRDENGRCVYLIYLDSRYICIWAWARRLCSLPNKKFYSFIPNGSFNIPERNSMELVKLLYTNQEILDNRKIGNRKKLRLVKDLYEDNYLFKPFVQYNIPTNNGELQSRVSQETNS